MTTPQQIRDSAEAAELRLKEEKAKLLRSDRTKLYSDDEHDERVKTLEKECSAALDSLSGIANTERVKAEAELSENEDLSAVLNADELANANARYIFISEEVQEMSKDELLKRLSGVAEGNDRASTFAHARATRKRAAAEYGERLEAAQKSGRALAYASRSEELIQAAEMLEVKLTGGARKRKMEDAKIRAEEYLSAQLNISTRKYRRKQRVVHPL